MKKIVSIVTSLFVVMILIQSILVAEAVAQQKPIKLKFAVSQGSPGLNTIADLADSWQKEVTNRTNGLITFENYWGGSLGAPAEHIEFLKNGVTDAGIIFGWYTPTKLQFTNFEYVIPFGPMDYELVIKARQRMRAEFPIFNREMAEQNAMVLADAPLTTYNFLSKEPLRTIDDFKGKKVGLIGRYFGRWLPPGATAVVRPAHDRYDMLKTGVLDIDLNPTENQYVFKLHEVTRYSTKNLPIITLTGSTLCMNINSYKKLPPEFQKIVVDAGKNLEERAGREILPNWDKKIFKEWEKGGVKFIEFPEQERIKWLQTLEDIPAEWAKEMEGKGQPGFKVVQRYQEITAELGYKWPRRWGVKK